MAIRERAGTWTVNGGLLTLDGTAVRNDTLYGPGVSLEFVATFRAQSFQHLGFGGGTVTFNQAPIAMFSTRTGTNTLYTSVLDTAYNDVAIANSSSLIGSSHRYRIDWKSSGLFDFYVDGALVSARTANPITSQMRVAASDYAQGGLSLLVDSIRMTPYVAPCTFTSRVLDAGQLAHWIDLSKVGLRLQARPLASRLVPAILLCPMAAGRPGRR